MELWGGLEADMVEVYLYRTRREKVGWRGLKEMKGWLEAESKSIFD